MLLSMAWRNVWRNRRRSAVILLAIALGLWAGLVTCALMYGMSMQVLERAIEDRVGHVQVHAPGYRDSPEATNLIPAGGEVLASLERSPHVRAASGRLRIDGAASSPAGARGVRVLGVDPAAESAVLNVARHITEGGFLSASRRNPVVIGERLARKLDVELGSKIVLQGQGAGGDIDGGAFRVAGLFRTVNSEFDKRTVFVRRADLARIFGLGEGLHQIVLTLERPDELSERAAELADLFPGLDVADWRRLEPELSLMNDAYTQYLLVFLVIILVALAFGITNTMLMGVIERVREFGVIIALGMNHARIFLMILLETLLLTFSGCAAGIAAGWLTIAGLGRSGLDLSIVSEGLEAYGMETMLYPALPLETYVQLVLLTGLTAFIAACYPGLKAARLNPVEAIRTY